jgi:hypothetical protein
MREALALVLDSLGPMQAKPYIVEWERGVTPGSDAIPLYSHGVAWEKAPR